MALHRRHLHAGSPRLPSHRGGSRSLTSIPQRGGGHSGRLVMVTLGAAGSMETT